MIPPREPERDRERQREAVLQAWQAQSTGRAVGGWDVLHGVQVHSCGIPVRQWNGAFPTRPDVDLAAALPAVEAWFDRINMPWGLLVPEEWDLRPPGLEHVHTQPVMLRHLDVPLPAGGTDLRQRWDAPVEHLAQVQAEAFDDPYDAALEFLRPDATSPVHETVVAYDGPGEGAEPVGCATGAVVGSVVGVYGVAVRQPWRRRGLGRALTVAVLERARARGCDLAYLNPSHEGRGVYAALGFEDARPYLVWVRP